MEPEMKQMMAEMNASIQGLAGEMRASIQGLAQRFDGLEGRFDGLEGRFDGLEGRFDGLEGRFDGLEGRFDALETGLTRKFNRLAMEFDRSSHELRQDFRDQVEKMEGIYRHTAWAADSAKISSDKALTHGPMLIDHEDRIRALEGKRKPPPSV